MEKDSSATRSTFNRLLYRLQKVTFHAGDTRVPGSSPRAPYTAVEQRDLLLSVEAMHLWVFMWTLMPKIELRTRQISIPDHIQLLPLSESDKRAPLFRSWAPPAPAAAAAPPAAAVPVSLNVEYSRGDNSEHLPPDAFIAAGGTVSPDAHWEETTEEEVAATAPRIDANTTADMYYSITGPNGLQMRIYISTEAPTPNTRTVYIKLGNEKDKECVLSALDVLFKFQIDASVVTRIEAGERNIFIDNPLYSLHCAWYLHYYRAPYRCDVLPRLYASYPRALTPRRAVCSINLSHLSYRPPAFSSSNCQEGQNATFKHTLNLRKAPLEKSLLVLLGNERATDPVLQQGFFQLQFKARAAFACRHTRAEPLTRRFSIPAGAGAHATALAGAAQHRRHVAGRHGPGHVRDARVQRGRARHSGRAWPCAVDHRLPPRAVRHPAHL